MEHTFFDSEIMDNEIVDAVKNLNINKAFAGNLVAEHFVYGLEVVLPHLRKLFIRLYMSGIFPERWTNCIIIPVNKSIIIGVSHCKMFSVKFILL